MEPNKISRNIYGKHQSVSVTRLEEPMRDAKEKAAVRTARFSAKKMKTQVFGSSGGNCSGGSERSRGSPAPAGGRAYT